MKLAILDDYQRVTLDSADWSPLRGATEITVFDRHLGGIDAAAAALRDFEILCIMRERTPFPRAPGAPAAAAPPACTTSWR